jgi:hypothetical protein
MGKGFGRAENGERYNEYHRGLTAGIPAGVAAFLEPRSFPKRSDSSPQPKTAAASTTEKTVSFDRTLNCPAWHCEPERQLVAVFLSLDQWRRNYVPQ